MGVTEMYVSGSSSVLAKAAGERVRVKTNANARKRMRFLMAVYLQKIMA
jgi:hypothetical protein